MDDDGRDEEETQDTTTAEMSSHATSVDDTADGEPHDPDSDLEDDTTEPNPQDLNEQEQSSHDADSNSSFDEVTNEEPEDKLEPRSTAWCEQLTRQTICWQQMEARRGYHHEGRWTRLFSNWNPAISTKERGYQVQG